MNPTAVIRRALTWFRNRRKPQWHHVVVTFDGEATNWHFDGHALSEDEIRVRYQ